MDWVDREGRFLPVHSIDFISVCRYNQLEVI